MLRTERKMCKCFKDKTPMQIRKGYPACCGLIDGEFSVPNKVLEAYWEVIVREMQKKHPEWVMEVYLT
jgi:hypothetical protein